MLMIVSLLSRSDTIVNSGDQTLNHECRSDRVQCRLKEMAPSARIALTLSKENQRLDGSVYRFGDFVLQPTERMLAREGVLIPIQPKTFDALLLLVIHAGHLVSKTELMGSLWPDTHVREANLTNVIVSLRKLLGRESIRTVSKHGYRFDMPILCEPGVDRDGYESFLEARSIIQARSLQDMPRARELLTLSIAKSPTFAQGWAWLGRGCLFLNKFSDSSPLNGDIAQASLERALILQSDLTDAHAFLTMYEVDSGRALEAVVRLAQQLTVRPKQPDLYAGLVHALRFRGLLAESLQADEYARELDPQTLTSIAHTLFLIGDLVKIGAPGPGPMAVDHKSITPSSAIALFPSSPLQIFLRSLPALIWMRVSSVCPKLRLLGSRPMEARSSSCSSMSSKSFSGSWMARLAF
jgi:DNA-binding winged helix-turn-helix (wHTH) protein